MFGFAAHVDRIESRLVDALSLSPLPLPPALSAATGAWKGESASIAATAWSGPAIALARFVRLTGAALDIGNVLVVPSPWRDAPIFGVDLVAARPDAGLVVADLSPLAYDPGAAPRMDLPEWARSIFSASPVLRRITPSGAPEALEAVDAMAQEFVARLAGAPQLTASADATHAQRRYMEAHRSDERTVTMLANIFGTAWATPFVSQVLYPVPA